MSTSPLSANAPARRRLEEVGRLLHSEGVFTGGPPEYFEIAGRLQLATLIREGLYPDSKVLDLGCGCLRGGYWLIHFLDRGRYFGIEPNAFMLQKGIQQVLESETLEQKRPRFDTNDRYDLSVFGEKLDVVLARSVWSHAPKSQVEMMLDSFVATSSLDAFFLTSYYPASFWRRKRDYKGEQWKGRSHRSSTPGQVHHSFGWIKKQVEARGMFVRQLPDLVFNGQYWLKISRNREQLQGEVYRFR
jgi:SAM-dependent methyltransferase